ncbi:ferrochelatase [Enterococcus camelliae]|uniref:Coproporphyrin III ferrochelatase n=1 Tax=Enterococcus camelliae TaxID=453959 RepID=A0ABW5THA5_9ENTE
MRSVLLKKGLMIVNLGTPDEANPKKVREFLAYFLSDSRVIKMPKLFWKMILHAIILRVRPKKSAELYKKIWTKDGSPLLEYTKAQAKYIQQQLPDVQVEYAMSYSTPFINDVLDSFIENETEFLTIVPLYPQYSGTTVGSIFDTVAQYFLKSDKIVNFTFFRSYYSHPIYINYYVKKIKAAIAESPVDGILFSYHGIPERYEKDGDNYRMECQKTTDLIVEQLPELATYLSFQSKFGPGKWLQPATSDCLQALPSEGVKRILVVAPGFVVDCLETIEELGDENRHYFLNAGGVEYRYLAPFNADKELGDLIIDLYTNPTK